MSQFRRSVNRPQTVRYRFHCRMVIALGIRYPRKSITFGNSSRSFRDLLQVIAKVIVYQGQVVYPKLTGWSG